MDPEISATLDLSDLDLSAEIKAMEELNQLPDPSETPVAPVQQTDAPAAPSPAPVEPEKQTDTPSATLTVSTEIVRQENETDGHFALRQRMAAFKAQKDSSTSPEEKKELSNAIKSIRKQLPEAARQPIASEETPYQPNTQPQETDPVDVNKMSDAEYEAYVVKENAKKAGFLTQEDLDAALDARERSREAQRAAQEAEDMHIDVADKFVQAHPEYQDEQVLEQLLNVVQDMYNVDGKNKQELMGIYERAHNDLFGISSSVVKDAIEEAKKINTMDFTGSSIPTPSLSHADKVTNDYLKSVGKSDSDIDAAIEKVAARYNPQ